MLFAAQLYAAWWATEHSTYKIQEQNLTQQLEQNVTTVYLDTHIMKAIEKENFDDVEMYVGLGSMLGVSISSTTLSAIEQENKFSVKSWRNLKAFASGFLSGKPSSSVGLGGSIASDMTLYGDLRDLKVEGSKYKNGERYDKFILQLSLIGVGLSATQLFSAGTSTPLKVGASVMKVARKSGNLTKSFSKVLSKRLSKTIDIKLLKTYNPKVIAKNINLVPIKGLFKEVNSIKKYTSTADTLALLKYVDNSNDLRKIGKLSKTYKTNTKGVMKVLGKGALGAGKSVLKVTSKLIAGAIGFVLSFFGFMGVLLMQWYFLRKVKGIVS
jgi:hypothetical protein